MKIWSKVLKEAFVSALPFQQRENFLRQFWEEAGIAALHKTITDYKVAFMENMQPP